MLQTMIDQMSAEFLNILSKHLKLADDAQSIPMDKNLEDLGLDSMGAINLLLDLEDSFDISFPDSLLTEETFRTAETLYSAVNSLITH